MTMKYPWEREDFQTSGISPTNPQQIQQEQQPQQPQMGREQWRDAWMGQGQMTPEAANSWLQANGATQMQGGEKAGRWMTPHGEALDLQIGRSGAMATGGKITPGWTSLAQSGGSTPQQQSSGGIGPSWNGMNPQPMKTGQNPMARRKPMSPYGMTQGRPSSISPSFSQPKGMM